jgi:hypothetical protein
MLDATRLIARLERFGAALPAVVTGIPADDARWKPADGAWSVVEIVRHLGDEEVDDFRRRLQLTLDDPAADWPPIDPEGWAVERRYNEDSLDVAAARFAAERRASVAWLRGVAGPNWSNTHLHPKGWSIRAGDLLSAWAAHDALHLRQIAKRLYQLAQRDGGEYVTVYAGEWRA